MRRLLLLLLITSPAVADPKEEGFKPLFNGKDLTGWVNVNGHPSTFYVKDEMIVTTGKPTGFLRSDKQYENFILEMEWMHTNTKDVGNSGLFVWGDPLPAVGSPYTRGIEVQVLVNLNVKDSYTSHGDLFSIWGAKCKPDRPHPKGWERCLPSELLCKGGGEWNHYRVVANDGVIKLSVNGKEVSGVSECNPRKGYLALESEGAECKFKNIKIKELPSTNPKPSEIADEAKGHTLIYNGLDFGGLTVGKETAWKANVGNLRFGGSDGKDTLATTKKYQEAELVFDWQTPAKGEASELTVTFGGEKGATVVITPTTVQGTTGFVAFKAAPELKKAGGWNRAIIRSEGDRLLLHVNGKLLHDAPHRLPKDQTPRIEGEVVFAATGPVSIMHPYILNLKK